MWGASTSRLVAVRRGTTRARVGHTRCVTKNSGDDDSDDDDVSETSIQRRSCSKPWASNVASVSEVPAHDYQRPPSIINNNKIK